MQFRRIYVRDSQVRFGVYRDYRYAVDDHGIIQAGGILAIGVGALGIDGVDGADRDFGSGGEGQGFGFGRNMPNSMDWIWSTAMV